MPIQSLQSDLLSIGVPVYNEEAHVAEALRSLLAQEYPSIEVIISDNASTDGTVRVCQAIAAEDSRVSLHLSETNRNAGWNFQNVLSLARGEFFMWAGAHDRWAPDFASSCIEAIRRNHGCVSAFPTGTFMDDAGKLLDTIRTAYDTTGAMASHIRPWFTAWALLGNYAFPFYGVHLTKAITGVAGVPPCYGPDTVVLFELAFLGSTAFVGGPPRIFMRQRRDSGDWQAYFGKLYGTSDLTIHRVLLDTTRSYRSAIGRQANGLPDRAFHGIIHGLFSRELRRHVVQAVKAFRPSAEAEENRRLGRRVLRLISGQIPLKNVLCFPFRRGGI